MTRYRLFLMALLATLVLLSPVGQAVSVASVSASPLTLPPDTVQRDSAQHDTLQSDTLREVTVRGDSVLRVKQIMDSRLGRGQQVRARSVGDLLEKLSPGINDKITHPFAVKQRKQECRKKKLLKALDDYEHTKTFDELLDEAVKRQQMEDERARREADKDD